MPDDEKQKFFNAYFERFLELRRQKETPSPVKKEEQRAEPQLSDADVVEPIPRTIFIPLESETRCDYVG